MLKTETEIKEEIERLGKIMAERRTDYAEGMLFSLKWILNEENNEGEKS